MAESITIKALQDASLDAKSLEEVVNGNESKQITTRLGETYPSVKKAIKTLFENGGLPATPFKTKALMTASTLANDKYAMVTDDTVNNGLYVKTAGTWVKSAYDPLGQAKTYTDTKITALPSALDTNKKVFNLDARTKFVASEIEGIFSSYDFTPVALASYDVNTTKDFIFSLGSASTTWASMWRMGHERNNVRNFELNTTFTVTSQITATSAIAVFIGDTVSPLGFMWFNNGSVVLGNGNAKNFILSSGAKPSLVYETAQELSLQVVIRKDNTGYVVAKNITTSAGYRLEFDLNALSVTMQGSVYLGVYRHSNVKFTYYNVQYPDAISGDEASNDEVAALSSRVGSIELELQSSGASEPKVLIAPPKGFLFTDYGFNIYRGLQSHKVTTDFDIKSKKFAATKSIYVNNNIGLDTNAGTEASPYKSLAKAITEANASGSVCNIFVKSGHYNYLDVGVLPILTVDTNIICSDSEPAVMSLTSTETGWVKDATYTNLYKKTVEGTAPIWAFDNGNLDEYGEGRGLLTKTTLALADAATGSIFIDGQTVYVRLLDDRAPDTKVHVIRDLAGLNAGATSIYIENIHVLGGYTTAFYLGNPDTDKHCYFLNCRFSYGGDRSFRVIKRNGYVYSVNCIASWAKGSDGFTYTTGGLDTTNIVEINCKGHHNGLHGGSTHNGSTVHQGGKIIRIGGDYSYNFNKNVADTGTGTQAWCIKCIASHAQDPSYGGSSNVGYVFAGGEVEGWLDDCLAYGSEESYNVGEGSKMHLRNTIYNELTPKNIVGTVDAY